MRDVRLPEFPCVVGVEVRFRDLDAMGHVNNAVYLTYFEQARLAFWRAIHPGGVPTK
ncbi:MAG: thioesterase family protein [Holophagales bacterium]|nr:thioesterase family protein [Holophagales bacterium]